MSAGQTYTRRQFLTYQELIEGRHGRDLDRAVQTYVANNRNVNLEQRLTFRQWFAENAGPRAAHAR